jgi:hypothetical protein
MHVVTQCIMTVPVLPSWCRSDSLSPRPASGPQRAEAGRKSGPWSPHAGSPVEQVSLDSASAGALRPRQGHPAPAADALEPTGTGYGAGRRHSCPACTAHTPGGQHRPKETNHGTWEQRPPPGPQGGRSPPGGGAHRRRWGSRRPADATAWGSAQERRTSGREPARERHASEATRHNPGPVPDGGLARHPVAARPAAGLPPPTTAVPRHPRRCGQNRPPASAAVEAVMGGPCGGGASPQARSLRETDGGHRRRAVPHARGAVAPGPGDAPGWASAPAETPVDSPAWSS